jgi:Holliday junction resolvasome RuvABC endonuclease subunit
MVCLLLELRSGVPSTDATDALAVAICCAQRARSERLAELVLTRK